MQVFYQPDLTLNDIVLTEEESKHAVRVLRKQAGDVIDLADGKGTQAKAIVQEANAKKCKLSITQIISHRLPYSFYLHLLIAPTKNFDRMEWAIEKLTEIGINEITFIETHNSERNKVNLERCYKVAISAMKQSKQWHLPQINSIVLFKEALNLIAPYQTKLMAWCETSAPQNLKSYFNLNKVELNQPMVLLIGPEGDFTPLEAELAQKNGFYKLSLGNTILRTETAAVVACAQIHALCNA